jgi:hypothetical protein
MSHRFRAAMDGTLGQGCRQGIVTHATEIGDICVGLVVKKNLNRLFVVVGKGAMKRGLAEKVLTVGIGTSRE